MTTTTTDTGAGAISFRHSLPSSRLGQSHVSLEEYKNAISPFETTKSKEYTLVIVTEHARRRILLGHKQRGFGAGFYNSFGGKLEDGEELNESAARELQEETGIVASPDEFMRVGILHFWFADSDTAMIVHVFYMDITTTTSTTTTSKYVNPSTIRPCDEIIPQWFDDYSDIPLHNMFADDSIWLTRLLSLLPFHNNNDRVWMEGYFYLQAGGQDVNTVLHHYISFSPPQQVQQQQHYTLEQRLFHQLHISRIHNPSIKEFKEAFAFAKVVQSFFKHQHFDVVIDVAGGHGALAAVLLMKLDTVQRAIVIDPADVGSVERAWKRFYEPKRLEFRRASLTTGLPEALHECRHHDGLVRVLVVACHACQHLSQEILEIACRDFGVRGAAVLPCCQSDLVGNWKAACKNLELPFATSMDLLLAGRVLGFSNFAYDVRIKTIPANISPQNRIILCQQVNDNNSNDGMEKQKRNIMAKEKLQRAYSKAHGEVRERPRNYQKLDLKSIAIGVMIGIAVSSIVLTTTRRRTS
jgi:8-oxo-dGTP pyrophosphatase MutT (NUDIX family)